MDKTLIEKNKQNARNALKEAKEKKKQRNCYFKGKRKKWPKRS